MTIFIWSLLMFVAGGYFGFVLGRSGYSTSAVKAWRFNKFAKKK